MERDAAFAKEKMGNGGEVEAAGVFGLAENPRERNYEIRDGTLHKIYLFILKLRLYYLRK